MVEHGGNHRRCRRLAVRACHGNRVLQPHQFGQHFGASYKRDATLECSIALGVAFLHCSRCDHYGCIAQIIGAVADHHIDAKLS